MSSKSVNQSQVKSVLASRIKVHSKIVDEARATKPFTPAEYAAVGIKVATSIEAIGELERVWEALFGSVPSLLEVHQAISPKGA